MNRYLLVSLVLVILLAIDFFNRVYTPVIVETSDVIDASRDLVVSESANAMLTDSLESWINPPPPKKEPEQEKNTGPTAEELEARRIAQQRARMKRFGVELGDKVFVLRAVSVSSAKSRSSAVVEVYDVESAKMTLVNVSPGAELGASTVKTIEPLSVIVTTSSEESLKIPLFKF